MPHLRPLLPAGPARCLRALLLVALGLAATAATAQNRPPRAVNDAFQTNEDVALVLTPNDLLANDDLVSGSGTRIIAVGDPTVGTVTFDGTTLVYTPPPDFSGTASFTYTVADNRERPATATVAVTVRPVNDSPVAVDDGATVASGGSVTIDVLANDSDVDGDDLTIASVSAPNAGTAVAQNGAVVYTAPDGFSGTATFTYTVSDGNGGTDTATVTVNAVAANRAPVARNDASSTDEDTAVSINVLANDSDPENDALTISSVTQPQDGTAVVTGATIEYTPDANISGTDTFTYTVTDGSGATATATVTVTVTPVNDPPVARNDARSTAEDTPVTIDVLANDSDVDDDVLRIASVGSPRNGTAVERNGQVLYTPQAGFSGTDTFTYTVTDGSGATATATVTVSVSSVNDAPIAQDDARSTPEDTAVTIDVLANDTDPDGDALAITAVSAPQNGTATAVSAGVRYTPDANFSGTDTFTYTISDGNGATATATVTVTVTPVNDAPVARDDARSTPEDTAVTIDVLANDSDPDGDALAITAVGRPQNGTAVEVDGQIRYTPQAGFSGTDTFTYTVADEEGATATATVTVTVSSVNDAPIAQDDARTTPEDTPVTIDVLANDTDPDGDDLTLTAVSEPTRGTATLTGSTIRYTPDANFFGTDTFTYTIADGSGTTATATVTVTVTSVNDAPVARDDASSTSEDAPVTIDVLANDSDVDGDALAISAIGTPRNGTAVEVDGDIRYTPQAGFSGTDTFTYTVTDGTGGTATATVTVSVSSVNDAPIAQDDARSTPEDTAVTIDVLANDTDPDGDDLTLTAVSEPTRGTATLTAGTVRYTPDANFSGTDAFTYTISDGNGATATATVTVTVTPVNDPPVARDDARSTPEDTAVTIDVLANDSDVDGDALAVSAVTAPTNGTAVVSGRAVRYTPAADFAGTDTFTYTVSDGNGATATATVTVTVTPVNDVPVARDDAASTAEDTPITIDVLANDSDVEGGTLTISAITQPTRGTASISGRSVRYVPTPDTFGSDAFTYTVADAQGATATATVTVTVTPVNDAPVARARSFATSEDTRLLVTAPGVLAGATDPDGDALTAELVETVSNGTLDLRADGSFTYTPAADYTGSDAFRFRASDGSLTSSAVTVRIEVGGENDAPVAVNDAAQTDEDEAVTIDVLANDSDADGDALTISAVTAPARGSAEIVDGTAVRFTPADDVSGAFTFDYTVDDGRGGSASATVVVTVRPVNDAPVARDDAASALSGGSVEIDVLANDSDPENSSLTITAVTQPANGTASIRSGRVVYAAPDGLASTETFAYTIADGDGATATATVTVTVSISNRAPVAQDDASSTGQGTAVTVDVLANDSDPDGDALTITAVTAPRNGTAVVTDGAVRYTPAAGFSGTDAFDYTVEDGSGATATATVTVAVDAQVEPALQVAVTTEAELGASIEVRATATGFAPQSGTLAYRAGGATAYETVPLGPAGDAFVGTIPATASSLRGIDYYVTLTDGTTSVTGPAPPSSPRHLRLAVEAATAPLRHDTDGYRMLSVPVELANPAGGAVLADDYGPYDPSVWRLLRWQPDAARYAEHEAETIALPPGAGFWLAARAGTRFDVEDGLTTDASRPATITLAPGWNQIGAPFAFPVRWGAIGGREGVGPPAAWDGVEYALDQAVLEPWTGYFVENTTSEPVDLIVPPREAAPRATRDAAGGLAYWVHLEAKAGELRDSRNRLGLAVGASDGRDALDLAEPPPLGPHVRVSAVDGDRRLAQSAKPMGRGAAWEVEVTASADVLAGGPRTVVLRVSEGGTRPDGQALAVVDLDREVVVPVASGRYDVELTPAAPVRRLRVVVGTDAFRAESLDGLGAGLDFELERPRPSPTRGRTTLGFALPERSDVRLDVFDALGRRVGTLLDGPLGAGHHDVAWTPADDLASGVYVVRLRAGGRTATQTVVVVR